VLVDHHGVVVMSYDRPLPVETPCRGSGRGRMKLDRAATGHDRADVLAADESQLRVIEIVAAEIVDHRPGRARCHERVDVDALVHEDRGPAAGLIRIIASDDAPHRRWTV